MRAQFGGTAINISIYDDEEFRLAPRLETRIRKEDGSLCELELLIVDTLSQSDEMFPNELCCMTYEGYDQKIGFRRANKIKVEITYELLKSIVNGKTDEERTYINRVTQGDRIHITYVDLN